jgi:ankyrin repeat protein
LKLSFPGSCEIVELLLSRGIDVDLYSVRGTPLHAAALMKQECTMKYLLEHHADVRHQFICSLIGCVQNKTLKWKILWSVALVLHLYILNF